jgi:hypothetical protein
VTGLAVGIDPRKKKVVNEKGNEININIEVLQKNLSNLRENRRKNIEIGVSRWRVTRNEKVERKENQTKLEVRKRSIGNGV